MKVFNKATHQILEFSITGLGVLTTIFKSQFDQEGTSGGFENIPITEAIEQAIFADRIAQLGEDWSTTPWNDWEHDSIADSKGVVHNLNARVIATTEQIADLAEIDPLWFMSLKEEFVNPTERHGNYRVTYVTDIAANAFTLLNQLGIKYEYKPGYEPIPEI